VNPIESLQTLAVARRVVFTLLLAAELGVTTAGAQTPNQTAARKPNILHIHADDHRADGLHALGTELLQTPNLDTLVQRGMTFTRCYTMGSTIGGVCLPSRTMMLSGKSWLRFPERQAKDVDPATTLPGVLRAAGYKTFHVGKSGNEFRIAIEAFDINLVMDDGPVELRRGSSERHADATIKFLGERKKDKPFYIYIAPPVPHDPRVAPPEFHKMYDPKTIPLPATFLPQHPFDNGDMAVRDEQLAPWPRTPENTKQQLADYYATITGFDHHIGRVLAQLKASGEWDNTIIIFTGDNGLSMGEHGLFGKQNLYEFGGMHVPCVIAGPGIPKGRSDALIYLMDLFPTFADFGGAMIPPGVEGKSFAPILNGKATKVRDVLYTAYRDCQRAVRDDRWKLIRYPLVDRTQLFDLQTDPREMNNLAAQPQHAAKVAEMTALLQQEMNRYADVAPLKIANPKPAEWTPPVKKSKPTNKP
jgi:arylsulfatase A-like enzyme